MIACYFKNIDIVDILIKNKADIKIQDRKNNLPMHIACYLESAEIIKSLINVDKSNLNTLNIYGDTPLEIAEKLSKDEIIRILKGNFFFFFFFFFFLFFYFNYYFFIYIKIY